MEKCYEVSWYKECYPFPDEGGKRMFGTRGEAAVFGHMMNKEGYSTWLRVMVYDPDEEVWYEY